MGNTIASREWCAFYFEGSVGCIMTKVNDTLFLKFRFPGFVFRHATKEFCLLHSREVLRSISFEPEKGEQFCCLRIYIGLRRNRLQMANGSLQGFCGGLSNPRSGKKSLPNRSTFSVRGCKRRIAQ